MLDTDLFHCLIFILFFFVDYKEFRYSFHQHLSRHPARNSLVSQSVYDPSNQKRTSPGRKKEERNRRCRHRNATYKTPNGCEHGRNSEMLVLNSSYFDDGQERKLKTHLNLEFKATFNVRL